MNEKNKCLQTWQFDHANYPWHGMTDNAAAEEKTYFVRAASKDNSPANSILPVKGILKSNDYVLMRVGDTPEVTVNAKYFSDLMRVDATRSDAHMRHSIGRITPAGLNAFAPRQLLTLLMHYHIIQTLIHTDSEVCLVKEQATDGIWRAEIIGEHHFYTNEKNTAGFRFIFLLNQKTGEMSIEGRD
jgi:hypothetical protein